MTARMNFKLKNIGSVQTPAVIIGDKFGAYELRGTELVHAITRHDSLRRVTITRPEFSYGKKQHELFKNELKTQKDYVVLCSDSVIYDPREGKAGVFYRFDYATPSFCMFKFYKVN